MGAAGGNARAHTVRCTPQEDPRTRPSELNLVFHSQVDLLHLKIIHGIKTQGARQKLSSLYVSQFVVFYSLDGQRWKKYKGNATSTQMVSRISKRTDLKNNNLVNI